MSRTRREYSDIVGAGNFAFDGQSWNSALQPDMTKGYTTYNLDITLGQGSSKQSFTEITLWQDGVISFGAPTQAQITFMSTFHGSQNLGQFPGVYVSAGYTDESGQTASDGSGDAGYGVQVVSGTVDWVNDGSDADPYNPADATQVLRIDWATFDGFGDVFIDKQIILTSANLTIDDTNYDAQGAGIGIGHISINGASQAIPTVISFADNFFGYVAGDYAHTGRSDLLFGQSSGALAEWQMNGTAISGGGNIGSPGGTWTEKAIGDFNGDGKADILFADASGDLATWQMNGTAVAGGGNIGNPGGTWAVKGVGDFNGDGKSDILFQDGSGNLAIWEMNGTAIVGGGNVGNPGGTWVVKGVGDFNGDGKDDILFENASNDIGIWELNGTQIIGGGALTAPGGTWQVKGVGDFNGDGVSDILFEDASGQYAIWDMNGVSAIGGGDIGNPGGAWTFAGIGDYNGDGFADILFKDASGDLAIWEMQDTTIVGGGLIGNPGSVWHLLG
jgi:hypothetical protein